MADPSESARRKKRVSPPASKEGQESPSASGGAGKKVKKKPAKKRRLTKKQQHAQQWGSPDKIGQGLSAAFSGLLHTQVGASQDPSLVVVGGKDGLAMGLELPAFSLELVVGANVWRFGRIIQIVGEKGSYKSGFALEIARMFLEQQGLAQILEHESKYSESWALSHVGYEKEVRQRFAVVECHSMDMWQEQLQSFVRTVRKFMSGTKKDPGPGPIFPVFAVVDSITGKSMQESQDAVVRQGHGDRGFPLEALSISKFMQTFPGQIHRYPFLVALVSHLKKSTDARTGQAIRQKPGGSSKEFQETLEFELSAPQSVKHKNYEEAVVRIRNYKNSLGTTGYQIRVPVRWGQVWVNPEDHAGEFRQETHWCWHEATTMALLEMKDGLLARRREILDLTKQASAPRVWSKKLGISSSSPVTYEEAGRMIQEDSLMLNELRRAFDVKPHRVFQVGENYDELIRQAVKQAFA